MKYLQSGIHLFILYDAIKNLDNVTVRGPWGTLDKYIYWEWG